MEIKKNKCSSEEHKDIDAIIYCKKCEIYLCNKCEAYHTKLFKKHQTIILGKETEEFFTGCCKKENHYDKLEYFCKNHNQLCCSACIAKIKGKGKGQHTDCNICFIEDIKDEMKNKLKDNIKLLEELSNTLNESINKIKNIFNKISKDKEELKVKIQKIFTKIRNEINNREDELLLEVDKQFENVFFNEDVIKNSEKLPNKIKYSLEKCRNLDKEDYNKNEISILINECLNIENNIKDIKNVNENIKKCNNTNNYEIIFSPEEDGINKFLEDIKVFGKLNNYDKNINELMKNSLIIKNDNKMKDSIIKWIEEKINKKINKFELILRMSENGTKSEDFHKYCDNKGPTLTLVKTTKNKIFGGFTPLNWNNNGNQLYDKSNQTFIFSLNLMKIYNMINNGGEAIYCDNSGPNFGLSDFDLQENMKIGVTYANEDCNFLSNENLELTGGKGDHESFETEELEVYKVIY